MPATTQPSRDGARHPSPPLGVLATVHAALFVASVVVVAVRSGGDHFPSPFAPTAESLAFFSAHADGVRWAAFLQLGSAVPLALFAASAGSRLRFLGVRAAGATIALVGGSLAAAFLGLAGALEWTLAVPDVAEAAGTARALPLLAFAVGGPAEVTMHGLLVAGVAVTAGFHGLLGRATVAVGVAIAAVAELSWLSLVLPGAALLLPLARFPALAWLVVAGVSLPVRRKGAREAERSDASGPACVARARGTSSEVTP